MVHVLTSEDIAGRLLAADCTATWQAGSGVLTISCPHGRAWSYLVTPVGDEPLPHFLWDLPWVTVPGSDWTADGCTWSVRVMPQSSQAAATLFTPQ